MEELSPEEDAVVAEVSEVADVYPVEGFDPDEEDEVAFSKYHTQAPNPSGSAVAL